MTKNLCASATLLLLVVLFSPAASFQLHSQRQQRHYTQLYSFIDPNGLSESDQVHYRTVHQLTADSDVERPDALVIEELHVCKAIAGGEQLSQVGRKVLILRSKEGDELMRLAVHETSRYQVTVQDLASILYLASEDAHLVLRNKVAEVECGLGIVGLLGTLAVALLNPQTTKEQQAENNSILPQKEFRETLLPPGIQSLLLTDEDDVAMDLASRNSQQVASQYQHAFLTRKFDYKLHPRFNPVKPYFGTILSSHLSLPTPAARVFARTVAFYLEPEGRLLHTALADEEGLKDVKHFLRDGYLMSLDERLFSVESQQYEPRIGNEGDWKMLKTHASNYVALLGAHHADYNGVNGEFLFPMETGAFDGLNKKQNERSGW